ncbi:MAG: hypothetical protein DMF92_11080 [Acidobacteria bacterium]|nr:MAG: hypothetical protein DMF92_11080 [Acidobacteriota bacterium]
MRIGVDARELCGAVTGVGRYLGGLLHHWAADGRTRGHEFILYAPEPLGIALDARRFPTRLVPGSPGTWWEQVRLPRTAAGDHLDVFFAPAYTAPRALRVPTIVAMHDLSFVAHPEWFRVREGIRRRTLARQTAARARAVVTISEFSRRELVDRLGVREPLIHVIPPGITRPIEAHSAARGDSRVLFVGSILNRRHVTDLIRAFAPLARANTLVSLDIVGDNRSYPHEDLQHTIATEQLGGRVRWHRYVSDARLRELYAGARAFAFLSEYEGLGLTPLEALAAGVPPVLLDTPVARESCGEAAVYVSLDRLAATTHALEQLLFDEPTRVRVLAAAPAALAKYSWPRAAARTLDVLEGCA